MRLSTEQTVSSFQKYCNLRYWQELMHATFEQKHVCGRLEMLIYPVTVNSELKNVISNFTACNDYLQNSSKVILNSEPIPIKPSSQIAMDIMAVFAEITWLQ